MGLTVLTIFAGGFPPNRGSLTPAELAEREALRREYIDAHRESLIRHLENTYIQYPDGTRKKLQRKGPGTR